jgi:hypothetical protein
MYASWDVTTRRMLITFNIMRFAVRSDYLHYTTLHYTALMLTQYGLVPMTAAHCRLILAWSLRLELFYIINTLTSFTLYRIKSNTWPIPMGTWVMNVEVTWMIHQYVNPDRFHDLLFPLWSWSVCSEFLFSFIFSTFFGIRFYVHC